MTKQPFLGVPFPGTTRVALPIKPKKKLLPIVATTIGVALDRAFAISRLEIEATEEVSPCEWIVNDIRVDGVSLFEASGDIPGDAFSVNMADGFVRFGQARKVDLVITYLGFREEGVPFCARLLGIVAQGLGGVAQEPLATCALRAVIQIDEESYASYAEEAIVIAGSSPDPAS